MHEKTFDTCMSFALPPSSLLLRGELGRQAIRRPLVGDCSPCGGTDGAVPPVDCLQKLPLPQVRQGVQASLLPNQLLAPQWEQPSGEMSPLRKNRFFPPCREGVAR